MLGLRTRESERFYTYFKLVQNKAFESECVFFLDSGDGREFETDEMEGEDLQGWLIPKAKADEFEKIWRENAEDDAWIGFFCWVSWSKKYDKIDVRFITENQQVL